MHYRLIATLPLRSTGDVLAEAFRYVLEYDSFLLRLKEHWRVIPGGIAIHDSFNNQDIPFGRKAGTREWDMDDHRFFTNDYGSYRLLDNPSVDVLDDILETLNDRYGADCFAVRKNDSGYGFYRCEPSSERIEDADELYRRLRAEGRSKGHAQWIVGSRLMDGRGVAKNHAEAERWLLLAWNNAFPGTARTEAFLLGRFWNTLLNPVSRSARD